MPPGLSHREAVSKEPGMRVSSKVLHCCFTEPRHFQILLIILLTDLLVVLVLIPLQRLCWLWSGEIVWVA